MQWPSSGGSQITSRDKRARMRTLQEFCVFCCHKCHTNSITHYVITIYIDFRNNIPQCHTFTLLLHPKNSPKHHPQNNFSTSNLKQPVTFHKTTRCFQQNDTWFLGWWSIFDSIRCDTCDSKKSKLLGRERVYARVRTYSPSTANTDPSPPSQSSKTNTHLRYLHTHFTKQR